MIKFTPVSPEAPEGAARADPRCKPGRISSMDDPTVASFSPLIT
jgi:hypothetical protein